MKTTTVNVKVSQIIELTELIRAVGHVLDSLELGIAIEPESVLHRELLNAATELTEIESGEANVD